MIYADRLVEVDRLGSDGMPHAVASFAYDVLEIGSAKPRSALQDGAFLRRRSRLALSMTAATSSKSGTPLAKTCSAPPSASRTAAPKGEPKIICHYNLSPD